MPYSPAEYRGLTFHDAAARFSNGDDTPRAYLERCLATIALREPGVKAWACLNEKGAREAADAATTRYQAGAPLSPIDGLPIGIKDLLETQDMPTEMGCDAYRGNFPKRDNAAVWACVRQARSFWERRSRLNSVVLTRLRPRTPLMSRIHRGDRPAGLLLRSPRAWCRPASAHR